MNNDVDEMVQPKQVTELSAKTGSQEANKSQGQFLKGSNSFYWVWHHVEEFWLSQWLRDAISILFTEAYQTNKFLTRDTQQTTSIPKFQNISNWEKN